MVLKRVAFFLGLCALCALGNPFLVSAQPEHEPPAECDPALDYPNNPPGEDGGCGAYNDCNGNGAFDLGEPCFEPMESPSPPPILAEVIEDILEGADLSDEASRMLEYQLMTPEERETADEPEISQQDMEDAEEEISAIFEALLDEGDLDDTSQGYINMMLEHRGDDGEHRGDDGEHRGDDGEHRGDEGEHRGDEGEHRGDEGEHRGDDGEHRGDDGEHRR